MKPMFYPQISWNGSIFNGFWNSIRAISPRQQKHWLCTDAPCNVNYKNTGPEFALLFLVSGYNTRRSFDCSLYNKVIVMHPMLNIAIRAARSAGNVIAKACGQMDLVQTTQKGTNDFVTNIDKEAEQAIVHVLRKSFPDHDIIGEENGEYGNNNSDYQWIIDP